MTSSCATLRTLAAQGTADEYARAEGLSSVHVHFATERVGPSKVEIKDKDFPELGRIRFRFDRRNWARVRELIDALNAPHRAGSHPA